MAPRRREAIVARRERPETVRVWRVKPASSPPLGWRCAARRDIGAFFNQRAFPAHFAPDFAAVLDVPNGGSSGAKAEPNGSECAPARTAVEP